MSVPIAGGGGGGYSGFDGQVTDHGGSNYDGFKGFINSTIGQDQNQIAQASLETDQLVQQVYQEGQMHDLSMQSGQASVLQSNQLVAAKAAAANAQSGNLTVEQETMRQYNEFKADIMSDDSLAPEERIRLLGELTQQSRAGDNLRGELGMTSTVGASSHGSYQRTTSGNGMNSMSMDQIAQGQQSALSGQGAREANSYMRQDMNMSMGGMGMGGMGMGGMGMGGMGMGGMGGFGNNLSGVGTGTVQGHPPPPPQEETAPAPPPPPPPTESQGGFAIER